MANPTLHGSFPSQTWLAGALGLVCGLGYAPRSAGQVPGTVPPTKVGLDFAAYKPASGQWGSFSPGTSKPPAFPASLQDEILADAQAITDRWHLNVQWVNYDGTNAQWFDVFDDGDASWTGYAPGSISGLGYIGIKQTGFVHNSYSFPRFFNGAMMYANSAVHELLGHGGGLQDHLTGGTYTNGYIMGDFFVNAPGLSYPIFDAQELQVEQQAWGVKLDTPEPASWMFGFVLLMIHLAYRRY